MKQIAVFVFVVVFSANALAQTEHIKGHIYDNIHKENEFRKRAKLSLIETDGAASGQVYKNRPLTTGYVDFSNHTIKAYPRQQVIKQKPFPNYIKRY